MDNDGSSDDAVDAGWVKSDLTIEDNGSRCAAGNNQMNNHLYFTSCNTQFVIEFTILYNHHRIGSLALKVVTL